MRLARAVPGAPVVKEATAGLAAPVELAERVAPEALAESLATAGPVARASRVEQVAQVARVGPAARAGRPTPNATAVMADRAATAEPGSPGRQKLHRQRPLGLAKQRLVTGRPQ